MPRPHAHSPLRLTSFIHNATRQNLSCSPMYMLVTSACIFYLFTNLVSSSSSSLSSRLAVASSWAALSLLTPHSCMHAIDVLTSSLTLIFLLGWSSSSLSSLCLAISIK
ncbi:hypothetical protein B0H13DRAFT_2331158 [Mycena leptocephala]|nr:hypothetical protein B0H13DRAFT_2331158 [Mycena leptocephala]